MKKIFLSFAVFGFLAAASARATDYGFDKAHSHIGFTVKHILSMVSGEFKDYDGTISFDPAKPEGGKVSVTIQTASINTDNEMRDHHLQSPDFFDAEKNPTITFKSTKVAKGDGENKYKVTGDLTMHGVTKSVVLDVDYQGADTMQMGKDGAIAKIAGFSATTTIDRRDFGLNWGQDKLTAAGNLMVANEVNIKLDVAAIDKASQKKMMDKMKNAKKEADKK
ncbi:MAG TPA: YceI family protein [bacterium]|nr:YceI family protein [bacterium]